MMAANVFDREVRVYVRDPLGALIPGSTIEWSEDQEPRGRVASSDGHADLTPHGKQSIIEVTAHVRGKQQHRKLAVGEDVCTFIFESAEAGDKPLNRILSSPVMAAIVTGIFALLLGYWQFVYKPSQADSVLTVFVKDTAGKPIPHAAVVLQGSIRERRIADDQGVVRFKVTKGSPLLTVTADAAGFALVTLNVGLLEKDNGLDIFLSPSAGTPSRATAQTPPAVKVAAVPSGTWYVQVKGDLSLQRVRSGTFVFTPQPDGRILFTARVVLDSAEIQLEGAASSQGRSIFLDFIGGSGEQQWNGRGALEQVGERELRGSFSDKSAKPIGVLLGRG